jgi:DNA-binding SARP family transcriptional activator
MGGFKHWPWRRQPTRASRNGFRLPEGAIKSASADAGAERRQRALALQVLAEIVELPPADAADALEYIRQLRGLNKATGAHRAGAEPLVRLHDNIWLREDKVGPSPRHRASPGPHRRLEHPLVRPSPPAQSDLVVRALGPLEVMVGCTPVRSWGGSRVRTVFEYLLLHRRPVHREVLMELLWPAYPPRSARNNLNVCMYGLRRALDLGGGRDYVVHRDGHYALNPDLSWSVDYARFAQAAEASQLLVASGQPDAALLQAQRAVDEYRGHLFDGDPNADWCATERAALADMFAQTLELLAQLQLNRGEVDAAQRAAQRLLHQDSCRESAHRLLMACHAQRNQRDQIVRQYRRCVTTLHDELDVAPSTETVRLFRQLTGLFWISLTLALVSRV